MSFRTMSEGYVAALHAALQKRGETEVKRTHKYIVYSRKEGGFYYIGKSGALRFGTSISNSISSSAAFKSELFRSMLL